MLSKNVLDAMNKQIEMELESAYLYLAMSIRMDEENFKGFAQWLKAQYHEELKHAEEFMGFIQSRGFQPTLQDIKVAKYDKTEPLDAARDAYEHECLVSASIDKIYYLAKEEKDAASEAFLRHFVEEQVEEEESAQELVDKFIFAGDSPSAKYMVDCNLASREQH